MKGPGLPDFESEVVSTDEQQHYLNALLSSQLQLARAVCSDSPFASMLQKRFIVLQRIFYAICSKYHDPDKSRQQQVKFVNSFMILFKWKSQETIETLPCILKAENTCLAIPE